MNRIMQGNHLHIPSRGAHEEGAKQNKLSTTTTCSTRVNRPLSILPAAIKNPRQEMQELTPARAERSLLLELAKGLALTSKTLADTDYPSPHDLSTCAPEFTDNTPSRYQRAIGTSSICILKPCLRPNETIKTSKQGLSRKKAVDFSTTARVRIIGRKTDKELRDVWYSHEEKEQLLLQAQKAVKFRRRFMTENDFEDQHGESTLGIEHYLSKALFKELQREKNEIIHAVLLFQETMVAQNQSIDHDALAHAYSTLSSPARKRAYLTGRDHSLFSHMMG